LLGEALALAGKIEEALATLDDAVAKAAVSGERGWSAEIHRVRGELTGAPRSVTAPRSGQGRGVVPHRPCDRSQAGHAGLRIARATRLARLWGEQGRRGEARDLLAPIYSWFNEGFDTADLKDAKALLDQLA